MSLKQSPSIVTDGLVFYYDMGNTQKSWKGKPTTNFAHVSNPRLDASYAAYSATSSGSWNANHPDAIRVYNSSGTEISAYSNTGVTDWTNAYHAIWTFDSILNRPVVTMRDYDGTWKAKTFGLGQTFTSMGLTTGNTYTISWLQWTDKLNKSANAGLYGQNTGGTSNFHDGQSNSQITSYNTRTHTWQRVYATFTVSAVWNLTASLSCYMYGHYGSRGTVKIADVQIETGVQSGFSTTQTRSNTQSIVDLTGNITLNANSLVYNDDNTFQFDGSTSWISTDSETTLPLPSGSSDSTMLVWCMPDPTATSTSYSGLISYGRRNTSGARVLSLNTSGGATIYISSAYWGNDYVPNNVLVQPNNWNMVAMTTRGSVTSNNTTLYRVNNSQGLNSTTGSSSAAIVLSAEAKNLAIGSTDFSASGRTAKGRIAIAMIYNRSLSEAEIRQNFNAMKERFYGYQTLKYINSSNVTVTGNRNILEQQVDMFKNANNNSWDGQVYSLEPFTAPCTIEFNKEAAVADNSVSYAMIGWNEDPTTNASYTSIDHASYPYRTDSYVVYNNGTQIVPGVTWDTTKKLYVVYDTDGYIRHYNGDKLLYSVNYGTGKTVYVDSSFYSVNATYGGFKNVKVSRKSWNGTSYS